MRKYNLTRLILPVITILLASYAFTSPAHAAAFAKFDGIDGESKDAQHDKWIDVLSVSESIGRPVAAAAGSTRTRAAAVFEDIVLVKEIDKSSVKLREKLAQGAVIPKLEIELTATYGGARVTYFKYELKNVQITSFSFNASGNDGIPATEQVGVNFEEIKWTYTEYDDTGLKKGDIVASWKVEEGTN